LKEKTEIIDEAYLNEEYYFDEFSMLMIGVDPTKEEKAFISLCVNFVSFILRFLSYNVILI